MKIFKAIKHKIDNTIRAGDTVMVMDKRCHYPLAKFKVKSVVWDLEAEDYKVVLEDGFWYCSKRLRKIKPSVYTTICSIIKQISDVVLRKDRSAKEKN